MVIMNDWQYKWLSEQVYWIEEIREDVPYHPTQSEIYPYNAKNIKIGQFQVLKVTDNTENGMQGMAVAPVVNGKADLTHDYGVVRRTCNGSRSSRSESISRQSVGDANHLSHSLLGTIGIAVSAPSG